MRKLLMIILLLLISTAVFAGSFSTVVKSGENFLSFPASKANLKTDTVELKPTKGLIVCSDDFSGYFEISKELFFLYANESFRPGKPINCAVDKTLTKDGKAQNIKIFTGDLEFKSAEIIKGIAGDAVRISFNDEIDRKSLDGKIKVHEVQKGLNAVLGYTVTPERDSDVYILHLNSNYGGGSINVNVNGGYKSTGGALAKSEKTIFVKKEIKTAAIDKNKAEIYFEDEPQSFAGVNGSVGIRFFVHYSTKEDGLKNLIEVEPKVNFTVTDVRWLDYYERNKLKNTNIKNDYYFDINGDFKPGVTYKVRVKSGFETTDAVLKKDALFNVKIVDRDPFVSFKSDKPYLVADTKGLQIKYSNIHELKIAVEKVIEPNYRYLAVFGELDSSVGNFTEPVFTKTIKLGGKDNRIENAYIPVEDFTAKDKTGVYLVRMFSKDISISRPFVLTNTSITVKTGENQVFVYASDLMSLKPVKKAAVKILNNNNKVVAEGRTDSDGVYIFEKENLDTNLVKAVFVERDDDFCFISLNSNSKVYLKDYESAYNKAEFIPERYIYRPGDSGHFVLSVRDKFFKTVEGVPVKLEYRDPEGNIYSTENILTDKFGLYEKAFKFDELDKTGKYQIYATINGRYAGSLELNVEDFIPHQVEGEININKDAYSAGEFARIELEGRYIFGKPASNLKAEFKTILKDIDYKNNDFKGFSFSYSGDTRRADREYNGGSKSFELDENGKHSLLLPIRKGLKSPSIIKANLEFTIFDDGRAVNKYKSFDIYPYKNMAGLRILGEGSIENRTPFKIAAVLVDPAKNKKVDSQLIARVYKKDWYYNYEYYSGNGRTRWDYKLVEQKSFGVKSGETFEYLPEQSGSFVIEVEDPVYGHKASEEIFVSGWDYDQIGPVESLAKLDMKFKDVEYSKGDDVKVDVISPFRGMLLVTAEQGKVLYSKLYEMKENTASFEVPVDFEPDKGFKIHAYAYRIPDKNADIVPFRAQNNISVRGNSKKYMSDVKLETAEKAESGDDINILVKTGAKKGASVVVSVVDVGILNILNKPTVDILYNFLMDNPLRVSLFDFYGIIEGFETAGKKLSFGGDGEMDDLRRRNLSPDSLNKRVKPFSLWSGRLKTDANGEAKFNFKIPNYNGKAKITVNVFENDRAVVKTAYLTVADKVIIKPVYPRFMLEGDTIKIPVRVFNNTQKGVKGLLKVTASGGLNSEIEGFNVDVAPNTSKVYDFYINAVSTGEKNDLKFEMKVSGKNYYNSVEMPIHTPKGLKVVSYRSETNETEKIVVPDKVYVKGKTEFDLLVSNNYLAALNGEFNELVSYPYGCAEQTSSKLFALLYVEKLINNKSEKGKTILRNRNHYISKAIEKLELMQTYNGFFTYWPNGSYVNVYASVYAADALYSAKKMGFTVHEKTLEKADNMLINVANGNYSMTEYDNFTRVYAAYTLFRNKKLKDSTKNSVVSKKFSHESIPMAYMVAAMTKDKSDLNYAEGLDLKSLPPIRVYNGSFYSSSRDAAFAFMVRAQNFEKNFTDGIMLNYLIDKIKKRAVYSTQDQAFILRALFEYYGSQNIEDGFKAEVTVNGDKNVYDERNFDSGLLESKDIIIKPIKGTVSYSLDIYGYEFAEVNNPYVEGKYKRELDTESVVGIERKYVDENGGEVDLNKLSVGDTIYSVIHLSSHMSIDNMYLVDRIPSCFEIVNTRVNRNYFEKFKSKNINPDYVDIRDDRKMVFFSLEKDAVVFTPLRVVSAGRCAMPPARIGAMYDTRIKAHSLEYRSFKIIK